MLNPQLPAYHVDEVFDTIDVNHDGEIDFNEFSIYVLEKEGTLRETFDKVRLRGGCGESNETRVEPVTQ